MQDFDFSKFPLLGLGIAALVIFAAVALFMILRGALRALLGTAILCASAYLAFLAWQRVPAHFDQAPSWLPAAIAGAVFVAVFFVLRLLGRFLSDPFGRAPEDPPSPGIFGVVGGLFLSLVPTAALVLGAATLLHHFGSLAEIESFSKTVRQQKVPERVRSLVGWKEQVDDLLPASWMARLDPASDQARVGLAKLISLSDNPPPKAIPVLEETRIRELVQEDPRLRELAAKGRYAEILHDPRLDRLLENDDLRQVLAGLEL